MMLQRQQRRGTIVVEAALVYPILFMMIFGIIMLSMAVFRHQQVSHLAREGARWASVHGAQYAADTGNAAATADDVYNTAIKPRAVSLDLKRSDCTISWNLNNAQATTSVVSGATVTRVNIVTVQIVYPYKTGIFGTINIKSIASVPMSF